MMQKMKKIMLAVLICVLVGAGVLGAFLIFSKEKPTGNKANVSWYTEDGKEFVITTSEELYGLVKLSEYYDFSGQTIKLGADIVVNEGNAEAWAEKAPSMRWFPINGFAGTFDGQGHTISGLYGYGVDTTMGLFSSTKMSCSIKNFKLVNSYFKVDGLKPVGSIVANGCGTFDEIYSDAIVTSNGENAGGIIGNANDDGTVSATAKATKITNCWFDGQVIMTTKTGRYGGGIVGRVFGGTLNIAHCLNSGKISAESEETNGLYVGGIFGALTYTNFSGAVTLEDTLNVGKIEVNKATATGSIAGGTLANSSLIIKDTYTTEQSYTEVCSYQKSATTGGVPMMNTDFIQGKEWYSWTTLDYEQYWTLTNDSTPILRCFADEVIDTSGLAKAYSFDWYNQYAQESIIDSAEDLYGFALMSYSETFQNKVVKLGADITLNDGKATQWASGKNLPDNCWLPIGRTPAFQGTFDGDGHTISGVYGTTSAPFMGLFGWVGNNAEVKNFRLTNSYFELTSEKASALGSVTGRLEGKINTVYSDALVHSDGVNVGGIAGYKLTDIESTITNCWYDGTIYLRSDAAKNSGGIMGRLINGTITIDNCLFSGDIEISGKKRTANTGGFIGNVAAGTVNLKGSLNSGEIKIVGKEDVYACGRVFGQVADSDAIKITFENTYFTDKGSTYFWYCAGKKPVVVGGAELKLEKSISGYDGYRTTGLDFKNYWSVVVNKDSTPILKSFAKKSPSVAGLAKTFDKSWYNPNQKTYVLNDAKDLYGFLYLSNSKIDFSGKTIKLGKDIVVNSGLATDWAEGKNLPISAYNWGGIGKHTNFQGTFDGQGHTISGLYGTTDTSFMGLFGWVGTDGSVKNVRLTNSYLESTVEDSAAIGSIVGRLEGDIHTAYSDAIIKTSSALNGGIAGYKLTADTKSSITNSWYAGTMYMLGNDSKHSGGIVGRVIGGELELNSCLFTGKISIGGETRSANTGGLAGNINGTLIIKNCLNDGVFEVTEAEKMNSTCRVIGQVSNVDSANVYMENTYFTNKGDNGTWFWYNTGDKATILGSAEIKEEEDILGKNGYITTTLNFSNSGYWTIVENEDGAPILKSFASKVPSVAGLEKNFDTSWYDEKKDVYVLTDRKDLYGFVYLSNSNIDFKGKTVTLGNDIEVNTTGTAEEWATGTVPTYKWAPISEYGTFEGTFDGKGNTISGIYATEHADFMGLFGRTGTSSVIKNLRLENSYFERSADGGEALGSIVGRCDGDLLSVYSDAIIKSANALTGGLAGYKNTESSTKITNSWYAGKMILTSKYNGGIIGKTIGGPIRLDNCLFSGEIHLSGISGNSRIGGFVGHATADVVITNCLNSGEFFNEDDATLSGIGRVAGQNDEVITTEKVYIVDKGFSGSSLWYSPGTEEGTKPEVIQVTDIVGEYGYYFTKLDFETYWTTVLDDSATVEDESGAPILQTFASEINPIPTPPSYADISWYDESDSDYTIYDSADLFGLAYLSKTGITFKDKTIKIADTVDEIEINAGTVEEWMGGTVTPQYNWEPIGKKYPFAGTFDGNGKTISGLYIETDAQGAGLFRSTAVGSTIQNLRLENSYINTTAQRAGSVVGSLGGSLINVYSSAKVNSSNDFAGGLVGQIFGSDNVNLTNCWFDGTLNARSNAGGIVGIITSGTITMQNCLNSGSVTIPSNKDSAGGLIGRTGTSSVEWDYSGTSNVAVAIEECLNTGDISGRNNIGSAIGWKQKGTVNAELLYATETSDGASADDVGVGGGALNSGSVIMVKTSDILGVLAYLNTELTFEGTDAVWALVNEGTPILLTFAEGRDVLEVPILPVNADINWYDGDDDIYTLSSKSELYGFAYLSSIGLTFEGKTINLAGDDIVLNSGTVAEWKTNDFADVAKWTPIENFAGTFNGNNCTIEGVYVNETEQGAGLFRNTVAGSTIKNLKLENSYITSTNTIVGSVVGSCGGNIENVYSSATIDTNVAYVGGIAGQVYGAGNVNIQKCWYAGTLKAQSNAAGIVGVVTKGTLLIENCLNSGSITLPSNKDTAGGLLGRTFASSTEWGIDGTGTQSTTIKQSLNIGTISGRNNIGSAVGWPQKGTFTVQNVYAANTSDGASNDNVAIGSKPTDTSINIVNLTDITVAGSVTTANVKATLSALDFAATWAIGNENVPVLQWAAEMDFDASWYDETATSYTLETKEDVYGFAYLSSLGVEFAGKTIELAATVDLNEGTVAEWKANSYADLKMWTPIENFAGTFNGNNHSIKGVYVNETEQGAGLFRNTVAGSTIKNLKLENSYITSTNTIVGSVVGSCGGNIENVYSSATIDTNVAYVGGIAGQVYGAGNVNIQKCWYAGTLKAQSNAAGIVGVVTKGTLLIENCLNSGSITLPSNKDTAGGLLGRTFASSTEWGIDGTGTQSTTIKQSLNIGTISGRNNIGSAVGWPQKGTFAVEKVYATNTSDGASNDNVAIGSKPTDTSINMVNLTDVTVAGTVKEADVRNELNNLDFDNIWAIGINKTPELAWVNNLIVDTTWYDESETIYAIGTKQELRGLEELNKQGITFAGKTIELTADVTLNDGTVTEWKNNSYANLKTWSPLEGFAGTFDGKNHSIKGVYINYTGQGAGFFRNTVAGSIIKNLKLENSYITSTNTIVGSVVGSCGGNLENVYSSATVSTNTNFAGGIVGQVFGDGNISIKKCWFAGTVNAASNAGGIVGITTKGTIVIENCLNSGDVTLPSNKDTAGGLLGRTFASATEWGVDGSGAPNTTIKNSLNIGTITGRNNIASAIGWQQKGTLTLTNVYGTNTSNGASTDNVGIGNKPTDTSISMVDLTDITVAGSVKAEDVKEKLDKLDFTSVWTIGTKGTPELRIDL